MRETLDMFQVVQRVCASSDLSEMFPDLDLDIKLDFDYYRVVWMGGTVAQAAEFIATRGGDPEDFAVVHFPVVPTDDEETDDED